MKNLKLFKNFVCNFSSLQNADLFIVGADGINSDLYCTKNGNITSISPIKRICTEVVSCDDYYKKEEIPNVVNIFYNPISISLIIALVNGDVLSLEFENPQVELNCVGTIESGLKVMEWSPDMETVVFVTGEDTLVLMTGAFDHVNEICLKSSDETEQEMVNVGWGSKETQFHGSAGKQAAKGVSESVSEQVLDDKNIRVSWRGDSNLFAVSYVCPDSMERTIKIYSRQGNLQYIGEKINGLNAPIAWRPSGNLIALTQALPNKYVICFMEKNGLRHGDFTLPLDIKIKELAWNSESTILSAIAIDEKTKSDCALVWTCSNYIWSLKQRLNFVSNVVKLCWDQLVGNRVHILLADGTYLSYQWSWTVDHSYGIDNNDWSNVAVIDGCEVKLTPFKRTIVPPPMCKAKVTIPSPALQVMFAPCFGNNSPNLERSLSTNPNNLCALTCNGEMVFISQSLEGSKIESTAIIDYKFTSPLALSHWLWTNAFTFLCVESMLNGKMQLCELQLRKETLILIQTVELDKLVLTVSPMINQEEQIIIQLEDGELLVYTPNKTLTPWMFSLPEPCAKVWADVENVYALSERYRLFINDKQIANNVTSFFYYPPFLIVTLTQHLLRFICIKSDYMDESDKEASRRLERGSQIIVALGDTVILQVPRGNLETIQPRVLTLLTAGKLLDSCDYKPLAQLLRRQRIDLNICVDHNPSLFLLSVTRFVQQIHDPQWLSVFLSELNEGDTTKKMYAAHYDQATRPQPLPNKVERVCSAVRSAMSQSDADKELFIFPILISHVKTGNVVEALSLANNDKTLTYLTLILDTDKLYNEALGAHDLEKALKVAAKSQKDPKEYVTFLNELREMEPNYMKYTIDRKMKKYKSALTHLVQCQGDARFQECLKLIKEHDMYALGLQLFQDQSEKYKSIALRYAEFLVGKCKYDEAGLMFLRSGHMEKAIESYTRAGNWHQSVILAKKSAYSESDLQKLYKNLIDILKSHELFKDASEVAKELLKNIDAAVSCLVEGRLWSEAVYLIEINQRHDIIDKVIKTAVQDTAAILQSEMKSQKDVLEKHFSRLIQVRQTKLNKINNPNFESMSDIQSESGSVSSFNTSSTGGSRSTKNTRKMQRKMWSLKEGNPREEQALLSEISQNILNLYKMTGEVKNTCITLVRLNIDEKASSLQTSMSSALTLVEKIKSAVWPIKGNQEQNDTVAQLDAQLNFPPTNCSLLQWQLDMFNI